MAHILEIKLQGHAENSIQVCFLFIWFYFAFKFNVYVFFFFDLQCHFFSVSINLIKLNSTFSPLSSGMFILVKCHSGFFFGFFSSSEVIFFFLKKSVNLFELRLFRYY